MSKYEDEMLININDVLEQSVMLFQEHPNSFPSDIDKNTFVINKLHGVAKKWDLSLKTSNILENLRYKKFKHLIKILEIRMRGNTFLSNNYWS